MFGKAGLLIGVIASLMLTSTAIAQRPIAPGTTKSAVVSVRGGITSAANAQAGNPMLVTAKRRRHGVMHFFFGSNRRRGGFFANLFHRKPNWWKTSTYRRQCKQRYRSYNPRTNSYRAYSGVRRVCLL